MSEFLRKSAQNFEAAQLLIDNEHFSSSVHCSYYGVFQTMAHILKHIMGERDERLWGDPIGSHNKMLNRIVAKVMYEDKDTGTYLNNQIGTLKNNRVTADYYNVHIDKTFSKEVYKTAQKVLEILKKYFKIQ